MNKYRIFSIPLIVLCVMSSCKSPSSPDEPTPASVSVTSSRSEFAVGETEQLTATVTMSDGTIVPATGTWGSDNTNVATVNQSGLVTGIAAGDVTIYIDITNQADLIEMENAAGINALNLTSKMPASKTRKSRNIPEFRMPGTINSPQALSAAAGLRGSKTLTVRNLWNKSGSGANVFDMPTYVKRVKITGTYTGSGENFVVWVGGELLVNEILGTYWDQTYFEGTYATNGGEVEVKYSNGVSWTFTQVPITTALTNTSKTIISIPGNREYEIYKRVAAGKR